MSFFVDLWMSPCSFELIPPSFLEFRSLLVRVRVILTSCENTKLPPPKLSTETMLGKEPASYNRKRVLSSSKKWI